MTPLPWSFSSLEDFTNCPRSYHAKRVIKTVKEVQGDEAKWGEIVHKVFEDRQSSSTPLPPELVEHEPFMQRLEDRPGILFTEQKIALDKKLKPCAFFAQDVWFRGIVDFKKINDGTAYLCDYKTGKPHEKWKQLALFAIHTFILHPVELVHAQFYWTKTQTVTKKVWARAEVPALWKLVLPDLQQYALAFREDIWQPRQSGLCHGWCPVTECEYWRPKRARQ